MRRAALVMALALFAAPAGAQQLVPVPWAVAEGGLLYEVALDGVVSSQHSTLHGALREAGLQAVACEACEVAVEHTQRWRMDLRWVTTQGEPEPDPADPDPVDPEPDPITEWAADSTTIYPSEGEEYQPARLSWMDGTPYLCVQVVDQEEAVGWLEVGLQDVDGEPYWVVSYPDALFWTADCDWQATASSARDQWVALYPVVEEEGAALMHVSGYTAGNSAGETVTGLQVQHQHVAGNRLYLSVGVRGEIDATAVSASAGGVSMDLLAFERPAGSDVVAHAWFAMADPPVGASQVAVTLGAPRRVTVAVVSVAGVAGERVVGAASASGMTSPESVVIPLSTTTDGELLLTGLHWRNSAAFPSEVSPGAVLSTDQGLGGQDSRGGVLIAEPTGVPVGIRITDGSGDGIHFGAHAATSLAIQPAAR